ncbi:MAG: lamin tail domain-containing protein, partial [Verrucomicrobiales bacterium]
MNLLSQTAAPAACLIFSLYCTLGNAAAEIVINEIHYNSEPNTTANEFVELYNSGSSTVDLSGWFFSQGISYTFAQDTEIEADSYLVIAERVTPLLEQFGVAALGPFSLSLAGNGETLELRRADGTIADTVSYKASFPWPVGAGGTGASMELINPGLDNDLGGAWRSSQSGFSGVQATYVSPGELWSYRPGSSE